MREIHIIRTVHQSAQTLGNLLVIDGTDLLFQCRTLELPWKDNQTATSCAPAGTYPVVLEYSPAFGTHLWELKDVPGRSEIKIHPANFARQLRGCIALGDQHVFIDKDQFKDIINSRKTVDQFHKVMAGMVKTRIHIHSTPVDVSL